MAADIVLLDAEWLTGLASVRHISTNSRSDPRDRNERHRDRDDDVGRTSTVAQALAASNQNATRVIATTRGGPRLRRRRCRVTAISAVAYVHENAGGLNQSTQHMVTFQAETLGESRCRVDEETTPGD